MRKFIQQHISNHYLRLVVFIFCSVFVISTAFVAALYHHHQASLQLRLQQRAIQVDATLNESFNYITYLMTFLGHQISLHGDDYEYISTLYSGFRDDLKIKNLSSWSMFDWLEPDKKIYVTSTEGILPTPVSLADRPNLMLAEKNPGKYFVNPPTLGKISKQWILPISTSLINNRHKHLGYINIGVTIASLRTRLAEISHHDGLSYAIFYENFLPIIIDQPTNKIAPLITSLKTTPLKQQGLLKQPVTINGTKYSYYFKTNEYPFIIIIGYDQQQALFALMNSFYLPILGFLILGIITSFAANRLYRQVIEPINKLSTATGKMTQENVTISLPTNVPIEIHQLACRLAEMNSYKQDLVKAKHDVEVANQMKTRFLANMSHELRTPLVAILGFSEALTHGIYGELPSAAQEACRAITGSGNHLLKLINELLDLGKIEHGDFVLEEAPHQLRLLIEEVMTTILPLAKQKNLVLHHVIPDTAPLLLCDGFRIKQVLLNLLYNAIKFTPPTGHISLQVTVDANEAIRLQVIDTGEGIRQEDIPLILSEYGQARHSELAKKSHGTGLGLPIVKRIIELHDACLTISSNLGEGTTITITFPSYRSVTETTESLTLALS